MVGPVTSPFVVPQPMALALDLATVTKEDVARMASFWNKHGTPLMRRLLSALPEQGERA